MKKYIFLILGICVVGYFLYTTTMQNSSVQTVSPVESIQRTFENGEVFSQTQNRRSARAIAVASQAQLPNLGSAPIKNVQHSIPLEEIRRGCFAQDCIPSVDDPEFITVQHAQELLPEDTVGIALEYKNEERFYPFNMLVTREIVNDVVADDPLLITYCPLCGTGVVYERQVDGVVYEFGVSGMLWQSNLLMYNRATDIQDRNVWSQVLGEAVVGSKTGAQLKIVPSNIVRFVDWKNDHKNALVLNTGRIGDPYDGDYYAVAKSFEPSFDEETSPLAPDEYVYGIEIGGIFKAYPGTMLPTGSITDTVDGVELTITKSEIGEVTISTSDGVVPDVEGFWFSWFAAHPDTLLWKNNQ